MLHHSRVCFMGVHQVVDVSKRISDVPEWFKGARLNYAENLLKHADQDKVALYAASKYMTLIENLFDVKWHVWCSAALWTLAFLISTRNQVTNPNGGNSVRIASSVHANAHADCQNQHSALIFFCILPPETHLDTLKSCRVGSGSVIVLFSAARFCAFWFGFFCTFPKGEFQQAVVSPPPIDLFVRDWGLFSPLISVLLNLHNLYSQMNEAEWKLGRHERMELRVHSSRLHTSRS